MKKFYEGMNEYRLEKLTSCQGHYVLAKNLLHAMRKAKFRANNSGVPWTVQLWKPKQGKNVYILVPTSFTVHTKKDLIIYYKVKGYDVSHIKKKNYHFTKRNIAGTKGGKY